MHPEGCLPFNLLLAFGTSMMVDVVVVDVFCALSAYEGPVRSQGQGDGPLVRTRNRGTGGRHPSQGLDPKACPHEGLVLWGA